MAAYSKNTIYYELESLGSNMYNPKPRNNRLLSNIMLPYDFYKFLKEKKYSIIHIHSDSAWKLMCYILPARLAGVEKIIVHSHASYVNGDFRVVKKILHYIAKSFLPLLATDYCTCSREAAKWMYSKSILDKVKMVNNGVDVDKFRFDLETRRKIRKVYGLEKDDIVLGTIGDFSFVKNAEFTIKVFEEICRNSCAYKLIFIGEGEGENKIKEYVKEKNLLDKVFFLGKISNVSEILNLLDVFLLPSRNEGLPVCGVEAQTNGLPVFYSDRLTRDINYTDKSQYISIDSGAEKLWANQILSFNVKDNDRTGGGDDTINNHFSIDYTVKQFEDLYG